MDTHQLAQFKAVYECGSMAQAAKRLFITPQGLSRSIAALETGLGKRLFDRTNHGVTPTPYARELYPKACKIVQIADSIECEKDDGSSCEVIKVASVSGGVSFFGSRLMDDFSAACPGCKLSIIEGNDRCSVERVQTGTVDCGVVAGPVDHSLFDATLIARHPHALIVGADSDLAARTAVDFADLHNHPVGMMGEGSSPYAYVRERLAREGVRPSEIIGFAEGYTGVVRARTDNLCFVTVDFLIPPESDPSLAVLPFVDRQFTWDEYFITRRNPQSNGTVAMVRNFLTAWFHIHETALFPWRTENGSWLLSNARH